MQVKFLSATIRAIGQVLEQLEGPFEIIHSLGMGRLLRRPAACTPQVFNRFARIAAAVVVMGQVGGLAPGTLLMIPPRALVSRAERPSLRPGGVLCAASSISNGNPSRSHSYGACQGGSFSAVAEITAVRSNALLAVTSHCAPLQ